MNANDTIRSRHESRSASQGPGRMRMRELRYILLVVYVLLALSTTARAGIRTIDFSTGQPPPDLAQITPLTTTTGLDYSGGRMNVSLNSLSNDGVNIFLPNFDSMCVVFHGLSLTNFSTGEGVGFESIIGDPSAGQSIRLELYQTDSVRVKIVEDTHPGTRAIFNQVVEGINLNQVGETRIDWIQGGTGQPDRVQAEVFGKTGGVYLSTDVVSSLSHTLSSVIPGSSYVLRGLDIRTDPPGISTTGATFDTLHTPEPSTLVSLSSGVLGIVCVLHRARKSKKGRHPAR